MTENSSYKLVRHRTFSMAYGTEHVWYTLHQYRKNFFGKWGWHAVKDYHFDFGGGSNSPVSGDERWAKAVAKELNIGVPKK